MQKKKWNKARGASMIEAAMTLPIFAATILFGIDTIRYYTLSSALDRSAHAAANMAAKLELETPIDKGSCAADPVRCNNYRNDVDAALAQAERLFNQSGSSATLVRFDHYNFDEYSMAGNRHYANIQGITRAAALVRPGEKVQVNGSKRIYEYPGARKFGDPTTQGWPLNGENWSAILATLPFVVHMEAQFRPLTPFLKSVPIKVSVAAFRDANQTSTSTAPMKEFCDWEPNLHCRAASYPVSWDECKQCGGREGNCGKCNQACLDLGMAELAKQHLPILEPGITPAEITAAQSLFCPMVVEDELGHMRATCPACPTPCQSDSTKALCARLPGFPVTNANRALLERIMRGCGQSATQCFSSCTQCFETALPILICPTESECCQKLNLICAGSCDGSLKDCKALTCSNCAPTLVQLPATDPKFADFSDTNCDCKRDGCSYYSTEGGGVC